MALLTLLLAGINDVSLIRVYGATVFSEKEILEASNLKKGKPYRKAAVLGAEIRIKGLYESKGYFTAIVTHSIVLTDKGVEIHLFINEGPRARLVDMIPEGMEAIDSLSLIRILMKNVPGELPVPYDEAIIAKVEQSLYSLYQNSGFPLVEIVSETREVAPNLISVRIRIHEGPRVRIREVVIQGNEGVKKSIIEREIAIRPGELYNLERIAESQRRIYATGLFSSVGYFLDSIGPADTMTVLYFTVEETSPRYLDIGGGYHTPEELQAKAGLGHLNLWGMGQRAEVSGEASWNFLWFIQDTIPEFPRRKLKLSYSEPYFLGFRLDATATGAYSYDVDLEYEDFTFSFLTRKYIGKFWSISPGLRWSYSKSISDKPVIMPRLTVNAFIQEVMLDARDNIFDPTRGSYGRLRLEETGWILRGDADLIKGFVSFATYSRLTKGGYFLASRVSLGYIEPYGRTSVVPSAERFTLGGDGTVRGYTRYSIGVYDPRLIRSGTVLFNMNFELRKHLTPTWGFALFADAGGLWKSLSSVDLNRMGISAGLGLRYYLPIGPIRLDWARPIVNYSGWGIVHLGLGHMF
ncbi:MAG: BamA/TamA family outer membrane protein [candidate division WOR-3 bacterium]